MWDTFASIPAQRRLALFLSVLTILTLAEPGWAQVAAAISGKVIDASGQPVDGATVTVKSLETGATRVVTTGETGLFRVPVLPLGPQEVKAEKKGFSAAVRDGIDLKVGQEAVVDLRLEVGELVQQVTVSEQARVVNTTTAM